MNERTRGNVKCLYVCVCVLRVNNNLIKRLPSWRYIRVKCRESHTFEVRIFQRIQRVTHREPHDEVRSGETMCQRRQHDRHKETQASPLLHLLNGLCNGARNDSSSIFSITSSVRRTASVNKFPP